MKPKIKKLWVEALRSGKYKQGSGRLRTFSDAYCCLGVLCDLHRKETGRQWRRNSHGDWVYLSATGALPEEVSNWAGLKCGNPALGLDSAISHNDSGTPFPDIADRIQKYL